MEENKTIIDQAICYIEDLFRKDSGGHDADHSIRVYKNALRIAKDEPSCDIQIVALAALLHDADDHKLFRTKNNANARRFLEEQQVEEEQIEVICGTINAVSFSRNKEKRPDTLEAKIVQDADRLDAIGAIGIARTFAFGGEHGRPLKDSIQHFYSKLLLLKDLMNTEAAKRMAQDRHEFLELFLKKWENETREESVENIV